MQTKLKDLWEKVKGFFKKLNKKTRILLLVCGVVILLAVAVAAVVLNRKEYAVLYTGLTASETSTVVSYLNDRGVTDFRIRNDAILVPAGRETQLQADLAMSGYLTTGFNYEYLTEHTGSFSTTAERLEATRIATEQKLAAMIRLFEGVRDAQVTITLATDRSYVLQDNATQSTAAVLITPEGNRQLSSGVVKAIRNTVAHSVKELNIGNVSVEDTYGNIYSDTDPISQSSEASALKRQYEQDTNTLVRSNVLRVLERIYGEGNVQVAVNTTVEMDRKVVETTTYDQPDGSMTGRGLIGNEKYFWERIRDENEPVGGTVGAGVNSDLPYYPDQMPEVDGTGPYAGAQGELNYHVDTTVEQREVLAGKIVNIQVAVTINQRSSNSGALSVDQLRSHVATASGIGSEDPESRVSVLIAPFDEPAQPIIDGLNIPTIYLYAGAGGLMLFLVLLIVILLLLRRRKKKKLARQKALEEEMRAAEAAEAAAAVLAAMPPAGGADIMEVNTEKSMELRKAVRQFAQNNPEIAAQMVRAWLKGEDGNA